jgi:hypothetical protein
MNLGRLRHDVLAFDLLHVLTHRTIGVATSMTCSRVIVRSGLASARICVLSHGQLSTFQQLHLHTLLNDSLEKIEEERRLLKTAC